MLIGLYRKSWEWCSISGSELWKVRAGPVAETQEGVTHLVLPGDKWKMQNTGRMFCIWEEWKWWKRKTSKAPDLCYKGKSKLQSSTAAPTSATRTTTVVLGLYGKDLQGVHSCRMPGRRFQFVKQIEKKLVNLDNFIPQDLFKLRLLTQRHPWQNKRFRSLCSSRHWQSLHFRGASLLANTNWGSL